MIVAPGVGQEGGSAEVQARAARRGLVIIMFIIINHDNNDSNTNSNTIM